METLKIIIKGEYFDMIKSGEKKIEYREVTPFWTSRLFDKEGKKRSYDSVLFINGYNKDARRLTTEFKGVTIKNGVYNIHLGKIIK
ncbi:MAG: ASCH domain-containing protein [Bacteroidota bacterium]|nr:ASCH domain-containing protein [Bacteroidota bacterium]